MNRNYSLPQPLPRHSPRRLNSLTLLGLVIAGLCGLPLSVQGQSTQATPNASKSTDTVTLNFVNAEIDAVARTMAGIAGVNVVVDPRVKGTLTLVNEKPVSRLTAVNQFLAALRLQGFTMVESAGLYKILPEADARLQSNSVSKSDNALNALAGNQIATQIFHLTYESANNLVPILRPLISPNNTINVNPGNNSLVVTDYADNLRRVGRIIAALDVSNATDAEILPLKYALASDLAPLVQRLVDSGPAPVGLPNVPNGGEAGFKTVVIAEPRSNALILRAGNSARLTLAKSLVQKLDQPSATVDGNVGNIYVVYLKNADATKLATTLRSALASDAKGGGSPGSAPSPAAAGSPGGATAGAGSATGGQIQADTATNSLIITAPEPQYRQLRAVIDKLDARRAQVFVESLIAEVSSTKAAQFGIQWQGALGKAGDGVVGLLGTNFGSGGSNIISLATQGASGTVAPAAGLNLGAAQLTNGVYVLGFLAHFLESNGIGNVLSTPNLLTLDNEEAKIVIGQTVPFVTGQFTNTGSTSNNTVNPFQTIERKDVGLTLRVRPQISENGSVKLAIYQEVSSIAAASANSQYGPTTNKRTIESNVMVDDGAVVVLGGLLQDDYAGNQDKVPGLGDIPFFGHLFKSETRSRNKTNLMVFLRPVIVRDSNAADTLSVDRYELMRAGMKAAQPNISSVIPINDAAQLPALSPRPPVPPASTPPAK